MADPLVDIQPKPQSRKQQFGSRGVPKDPGRAHQRIRASRRTRPKPKPKATISGSYPAILVAAVESIRDRFDVSITNVMEKFIANGILDYGNDDEITLAGLKKATPFDKLPDRIPPTPEDVYGPVYTPPVSPGITYEYGPTFTVPPSNFSRPHAAPAALAGLAAGPPLPADPNLYQRLPVVEDGVETVDHEDYDG